MIFKRILHKIDAEKQTFTSDSKKELEVLMSEFIEVADGKRIPKLMTEQT